MDDASDSSSDDAEEEMMRQAQALSAKEYAEKLQHELASEDFGEDNEDEAEAARLEVRARALVPTPLV
jgi:hypothetical protein